jgi:beta-lactamase regulating signal transducer with metallopeptidase domain
MLIRLSLALADLDNLRQNSRPPADSHLTRQIDSLLRRSRTSVTRLKILVSNQLPGPVAFGFLRPTIVIPLSLATKSPTLLLEAILAHELAHIQRHDYLVNLGQLVIEILLFFNPQFGGSVAKSDRNGRHVVI